MPTGVWITGARGPVATTATLGLLGLRARLAVPTGGAPEFPPSPMPAFLAGPTWWWAATT
ncbi:hypothetical protein ABZZ36_41155 [Actinacidiphila glaucinigra]|uniref:hypothetical protein n=1 Tax=Actinacidiphila glaucinigra TaxID=235986 RepID=UPI0033B7C1BE